jgi:hypothetical protein
MTLGLTGIPAVQRALSGHLNLAITAPYIYIHGIMAKKAEFPRKIIQRI